MKFFKPHMHHLIESTLVSTVIFGPMFATAGLMLTTLMEQDRRKVIERDIHKNQSNARIEWPMGNIIGGIFKPEPKIFDTSTNEVLGYKPK